MSDYIDIHTHNPLKFNLGVANYRLGKEQKPTSKPFSAGIHPWDAELLLPHSDKLISELEGMDCIAIGEVGLDKRCTTPIDIQTEIFRRQVIVATKLNLPLIIHCVKAQAEVLKILTQHQATKAIFHGYIGVPEQLQELIKHNYHISFGFNSIHSHKTLEAIKICPLENIFLESDTSTENIATLYTSIAKIKGISEELLMAQINNNYKKIFQ